MVYDMERLRQGDIFSVKNTSLKLVLSILQTLTPSCREDGPLDTPDSASGRTRTAESEIRAVSGGARA